MRNLSNSLIGREIAHVRELVSGCSFGEGVFERADNNSYRIWHGYEVRIVDQEPDSPDIHIYLESSRDAIPEGISSKLEELKVRGDDKRVLRRVSVNHSPNCLKFIAHPVRLDNTAGRSNEEKLFFALRRTVLRPIYSAVSAQYPD